MEDVNNQVRESSIADGHETVAEAQPGPNGACSGECIPKNYAGSAEMGEKPKKLRVAVYQRIATVMTSNPAVNTVWLKDFERVPATKRGHILEELYPMRIREE